MKTCLHCKRELSKLHFRYNSSCRDKLSPACKDCLKEQRKIREAKHIVSVDEKICKRCNSLQPRQQFLPNKSCKDGLNGWCKDCTKDAMLLSEYGISLLDYNQMLLKQEHKCAICGTSEPLGRNNVFVVDHDHVTNKIRGLLCNHCNTGLGKLGDSISSIQRVLNYLFKNQ